MLLLWRMPIEREWRDSAVASLWRDKAVLERLHLAFLRLQSV